MQGKYDRLVKDFSELPSEITDKLNDAVRYKEACLFGEKALELLSNILGSDDKNTLNLKFNMAKVLYSQGKFDNALKTFEELESYEFDDSRNTLSIKHNRAVILSEKGYYAKALNILQDVLDKREKDFGSNDQETLQTKNSIAEVYQELGKNNKALSIFQEVLKQREETFGPNDQETLQTKNNIAVVHQKLGENNKALSIFQEVLKQREETFGFNHRETLQVKGSIAAVLENLGEYDDALKNYQEVLSEFKQILDDNNPDILKLENNIAGLFRKQGKYNDALEAYRKVLDKKTQSFDPNHPTILTTRNNMASVFDEQGDYDKALTIYNEILEENFDTFDRGELISTVQDNIEKASCRKNDKITPLHVAAANDSIERVKLLLKNGAIYNARTKQGKTPLDFAKSDELEKLLNIVKKLFKNVKKGNNQQVTLCLEKEKAIVNSRDNDGGGTPLYWAIHNGHMNTARLLLENGADPTLVTNKGNTPLHIASSKGNNEIVRLLLENIKTDKLNNFINAQTTVGKTSALHIASNIEVTRSLLQYGAVYNIKNKEGKTPLDLAESDELKGLLNLVEKLFQGVKERNTEQVTDCLNKEKIVVNTRDSDGRTPLHWAVCNNDLESVQALLDRGADATLVTNKGSTSLHVAIAVKGSNELIEALLNHVKDTTPDKLNSFINAKKNDDTTAIDLAKSQGNREIIEILNQEALQEAPSGNMVDPSVAGPSRRYGSLPL